MKKRKFFLCKNDNSSCIIGIKEKNEIVIRTKITDLSDFKFPKE